MSMQKEIATLRSQTEGAKAEATTADSRVEGLVKTVTTKD